MTIAHDVTLTLNWHELRCLANWAQNWSEQPSFDAESRSFLARILDKIRKVQPEGTAALTLRDELSQLHDEGIKVELYDSNGNRKIGPPTVN